MKRSALGLLASLAVAASLVAQAPPRQQPPRNNNPDPAFGDPLRGLTNAQLAAFNDGRTEFNSEEEADEGLGPVFNERSCLACHSVPAAGGASARVVTRIATRANGTFDNLTQFGGSLLQDHAITTADGSTHNFLPEVVPPVAMIVVHRRTTSLFGLGFVDATPDSTFIALAAEEANRHDGTAGRAPLVTNISAGMKTVGKLGWKAQQPSLFQFAGDAYLNEMGITSPQFPDENCPRGDCSELKYNPFPGINDAGDGVQAFADFMTMLAAPPRGNVTADANAGEQIFEQIGCTSCHTATLQTGRSNIAAVDRKTYHPYSDFLLHDMGSLGDGIEQGDASGREMRTAPLWGLRALPSFLHDGRATNITDAILAHDGQARAARDRFNRLDARSKSRLLAFLNSL